MKHTVTFFIIISLAVAGWAKKKDDDRLENVTRELQSLEQLRLEKTEALEKAEASRWDMRYRQAAQARQHEDRTRSLESRYNRLANDLGRRQEDLVRATREADDKKLELEESQARAQGFQGLFTQSVDRESDQAASDIPVGISERVLLISKLQQELEGNKANVSGALSNFFGYRAQRYALTMTQELITRPSFIEGVEHPVWRLRLGTVFTGELAKDDMTKSQLLLYTGKLQGKTFAWRSKLAEGFNKKLASSIKAAVDKKTSISLTIDVLQNKSLGSGFTAEAKQSTFRKVKVWFDSGGIVMYPLITLAFIALLLSLERSFFLSRKSNHEKSFMKHLRPLLDQKKWDQAVTLCNKSKTSLSGVLERILIHAGNHRDAAEKSGREAMLKEMPALEKWMVLIAAIGGSAPLLGLLGTVSGMITLFKVITDVGTNDPRILAGGISVALVTTQTGLVIAIPILLIHGYLSDKLDRIQTTISAGSMEVLNKIWPEGN